MALGRTQDALRDFTQLCKLAPNDKDAREKLKMTKQKIQQDKFAKAIGCDKTAPASTTVNVDTMDVDSTYQGPVYKSGEVTAEFCKELMAWQKDQKTIAKKYAYAIVMDTIAMLKLVETLSEVDVPEDGEITVCGDVHGQYYDLLNIWELNGVPAENNPYLFNGDFVDRGSFSVEVILVLFAWKLLYPRHVHLSRGNHETKNMNKLY